VPVRRTSRQRDDAPSHRVRAVRTRAARRASLLAAGSAEKQRQRDVLLGGELRDELAELEDEAETVSTEAASLLLAHRVEALTVEGDLTGVRNEDARKAVEQGRLARAARAHHGEDLAALHGQTGAAKRRRLSEGEHEVACLDDHAADLDRG
jgi:hypothetical protein